ncbi:MFS transporter [Actinomadura sediminis]|uniref:MFS transporter n=1 Tax=Actinomadura sediminis TaxID=1038904 RepID=A0ABW3EQ71_9ACTN
MSRAGETDGHRSRRTSGRHAEAALPRNFSRLWLGSAASHLGRMNAAIALPLLALSLTHSAVFAGWVAAAGTFPSLLLYLPAGVLVDRLDRRSVMIACQSARFAIALVLVIGLLTMADPAPLLLGAAAADGTLASLYNLAEATLIRRIVPVDALPDAMARNEARSHIALLLGRPLGGFLYGCNRSYPFIVDALTSLFSVFMILKIQRGDTESPRTADKEARESNLRDCARQLIRDPFLRMLLIVCSATNFAFQIIFLMLIVQAERTFESSAVIGLLFTASGLGGTLGAVAAPRLVRKRRKFLAIFVCVWGWAAAIAAVWVFDHPIAGFAAWGVISLLGAHVNVALTVHLATHVPDAMLARVTGINNFVTGSAVPLGASFSGYLLSMVSTPRSASATVLALTLCVALGVSVYGLHRRKTQLKRRVRPLLLRMYLVPHRPRRPLNAYHDPTDDGRPCDGIRGGVAEGDIVARQ